MNTNIDRKIAVDCGYYGVTEDSYEYGYVPALSLYLYDEETGNYVDSVYIYCLRGYDLRATKNMDLSGRNEGVSSALSMYPTKDDIKSKIVETINGYLRHPDTVKAHGNMRITGTRAQFFNSIFAGRRLNEFVSDTVEFVKSIRNEDENSRLKRF